MSRTKLFSGFGQSARQKTFWKRGTAIEVFKFVLCVTAPLGASVIYANPTLMNELILKLNLVSYPKAGPAPPSPEAIDKLRESIKVNEGD